MIGALNTSIYQDMLVLFRIFFGIVWARVLVPIIAMEILRWSTAVNYHRCLHSEDPSYLWVGSMGPLVTADRVDVAIPIYR